MPAKPKIGFYWCASCGGCEEAIVDLAEDILGVLDTLDIVFWPCAMDFKKKDVEAMPDKSIVATFLNGAIRTSEQEEMAHLIRRKSQFLIAYGSCAHLGGIPGLANQFSREHILKYVYQDAPTVVNEQKTRPQLDRKPGHFLNCVISLFTESLRPAGRCLPGVIVTRQTIARNSRPAPPISPWRSSKTPRPRREG